MTTVFSIRIEQRHKANIQRLIEVVGVTHEQVGEILEKELMKIAIPVKIRETRRLNGERNDS